MGGAWPISSPPTCPNRPTFSRIPCLFVRLPLLNIFIDVLLSFCSQIGDWLYYLFCFFYFYNSLNRLSYRFLAFVCLPLSKILSD